MNSQSVTVIPCQCGGRLYNEVDIRINPDWIECAWCGKRTRKRKVYIVDQELGRE